MDVENPGENWVEISVFLSVNIVFMSATTLFCRFLWIFLIVESIVSLPDHTDRVQFCDNESYYSRRSVDIQMKSTGISIERKLNWKEKIFSFFVSKKQHVYC